VACQRAHWTVHRVDCGRAGEAKARAQPKQAPREMVNIDLDPSVPMGSKRKSFLPCEKPCCQTAGGSSSKDFQQRRKEPRQRRKVDTARQMMEVAMTVIEESGVRCVPTVLRPQGVACGALATA
jgi:hypothetical protein